jgi:hypothetical protein
MLDTLLVLGQVPGTDFYITFSEVLLFFLSDAPGGKSSWPSAAVSAGSLMLINGVSGGCSAVFWAGRCT